MTKDEEVRAVVADLDGLLVQLQANVDALIAALSPSPPEGGPLEKEPVA